MRMPHLEALGTARNARVLAERSEVQALADSISAAAEAEVEQLRAWLVQRYPGEPVTVEYQPVMRRLLDVPPGDVDRVFLEDMVVHHERTMQMSGGLLLADFEGSP